MLNLALTRTLPLLLLLLLSPLASAKLLPPEQQKLTELQPTREQAIASVNMVQLLRRAHYEKIPLDDEHSSKILDRYLASLDPARSHFTHSDIERFEAYRNELDNALKTGDLKPGFDIYNIYQQRVEERLRFLLSHTDAELKTLDFSREESIKIDRSEMPWALDTAELQDLWRRQLKDSVLRLKLNKKELPEISELLTKRYRSQLNRLFQANSEDAFQVYINAFARIYDPHTQYFSPRNAENFDINMSLSLEGIGAVLQAEDDYTKVVSLVAKGPADKAGQLKPADKIVGVAQGESGDIVDVVGWRLDEVVQLIRGPKASVVKLEVIPSDGDGGGTRIYSITREKVKLEEQSAQKSVIELDHEGNAYKLGVIQIPAFYIDFKAAQAGDPNYKSTTRDVKRLLKELEEENVDGLVVDLRGNGGGSLQEANELTGLFIPGGPTVLVRDGRGRIDVQQDPDGNLVYGGPMAVLVDRLSASASEIFAGAMQDYQRALIIGGQTFGKGTVQTIQPLNHGQLKLTLAKFYRISGKSTQHKGVVPDIHFPSLYDSSKIGESALDDALPWDQIRPVAYMGLEPTEPYLQKLQRRHNQRAANDPDFTYLQEQTQLRQEQDTRTSLLLNSQARKDQYENLKKQRLSIENRYREARGEAPLETLNVDNEDKGPAPHRQEQKEDEDAFVKEAGNILLDFINMRQRVAANAA
ncbi:carboxy terminal-processing peptidase [Aestuariirhabdus sp. Z084]|uniref:carboxy terminal-processing peptidase n=1 Tax=Aestuariirhabdus haliotis TaxID=2918751 RepID=UPI00201B4539|nr:carboxy terminal-processing peptidase [Aestuariirhabdus haliotis]MCL6417787.1 carboxy terminal-processing peptidase [Aestuariirhabdus haliotis]MCL6420212.1 carboxy terminal-processing peptidase [Aestuariirhabdus haliotis]